MKGKIGKRFIEYLIIFILILNLNFLIPRLMPGDPFTYLSSDEGEINQNYSEEEIERYMEYYGLDKPLFQQYKSYLVNLIKGDLGYSIYYKSSVISIILNRAKWTLSICLIALFLSTLIGGFLGSLSAWYRDSILDKILYPFMVLLSEIPSFLIAILLLFGVAARSSFFPLYGGSTVFADYSSTWEMLFDLFRHAALPIFALVLGQLGGFYLLARNSMITVISKDYMRTAKAKGLKSKRIIFRHGLKNAMLPIVTRVFIDLGSVLGGSALVENAFNYPGIGRLMREAVIVRDYVLLQGIFLFVAFLVLAMNFFADIVYRKIDPRVN